jgi:hypothetical protein
MRATVQSVELAHKETPGRSRDPSTKATREPLPDFGGRSPQGGVPAAALRPATFFADFTRWLRTHSGAVTVAGLLSFAAPVTFFTGAVSVMREPTAEIMTRLGLWFVLYGAELWCLLLVIGYACQRLMPASGRTVWRGTTWLLCGCAAVAFVNLSTASRADILIEQGVVTNAGTMYLNAFTVSFTMALLYFAHLRRSRTHEQAASRLATAQAAQREARRGMVQGRLQAVQARIDPQLLFDMLDAVRRAYEADAARAEHLLDELIAFLRASLPRLRTASSSVPREAELARAYARLQALAGATDVGLTVDVSADAIHARFPPGVLLPLLDDALRAGAGPCTLSAMRSGADCQLVLTLPARPSDAVVARVRSLLADVYGTSTALTAVDAGSAVRMMVKVPYEFA